jgi:hypothetical protein
MQHDMLMIMIMCSSPLWVLTADCRIKVRLDLQADKSSIVVKGPFFPEVWTQGIESVEQCVMQDPI